MVARMTEETQQMQHLIKTHSLELAYEQCLKRSEILYEEENARRLRVNILLLEDDNDDLHAQLSQDGYRIDGLEGSVRDMQNQLDTMEGEAEQLRAELRMKTREVENLKAELNSLQSVSMDSTKLLTEKLALSRELATLRPEIEHLRSQVASHQTLLAEKLSLQRQLSTVQVELETEKRTTQRVLAKEGGRQAEDAKLEAQLDSLQAELAKERRERQKVEREAQKIGTEYEGKQTVLESRLEAFRNKLRTTKEQLKETQVELQTSQASAATQASLAPTENSLRAGGHNSKKRSLVPLDTDATIGTPGFLPAAKKSKRGSALPGDKSTFSITPFLNRTASVAPESPPKAGECGEADERNHAREQEKDVAAEDNVVATEATPSGKPTKQNATNETKKEPASKKSAASNAKGGRSNPKGALSRKAKAASTLEQVQEEGNDENVPPAGPEEAETSKLQPKLKSKAVDFSDNADEPTFIKRKRKILGGGLGRTLFDDDDADQGKGGDRGLFGGARAFGALGRTGLGNQKFGARLGGSAGGFGAFSPLKKDRKAVGS